MHEDKIVELVRSIEQTKYWKNVVVRKHPTKPGIYQLAYGHHRLEALIRVGITEAEFIVEDLDNETMIKVMNNENMEFGYSILSYLELFEQW